MFKIIYFTYIFHDIPQLYMILGWEIYQYKFYYIL